MVEIFSFSFSGIYSTCCLLIFCFHPYNKSLCCFCFGSLQMFGCLMFDFFSLSWSSKVLSQKLVLPFGPCCSVNLHHFLCHVWPPAILNFSPPSFYSRPLISWVCLYDVFKLFFALKGWIIDASNGSSQNTLLSEIPILACQMAFIMWYSAVFQIIWKKHHAIHLPLPRVSLSTAVAQMSARIHSSALLCILALCSCLSRETY